MCGIAGCWSLDVAENVLSVRQAVQRMTAALRHRGPDGAGLWSDDAANISLGHRRLAIIDLTESGRQPMHSESGRFVLTYNGEIYNFRDLRAKLIQAGHAFRGGSDSEVLLAAIEEWGVAGAVQRSNGMFAFALWDRRERQLTLARDRLGKKPLCYALTSKRLTFSSDVRSVIHDVAIDCDLDVASVSDFLHFGYIPAPRSIFSSVAKLSPGEIVIIREGAAGALVAKSERYWAPGFLPDRLKQFEGSYDSAREILRSLLTDAVRKRLESDVPLGAFLSGGIDSTLVVALMKEAAISTVRTYTVGFGEREYDEAEHARRIADFLGTEHTEWRLDPSEALRLVPEIAGIYDEPFGDSSQLPTVLLSRITRDHVTVALSGDGGDEWFGGYARYQRFLQVQRVSALMPRQFRTFLAATARAMAPIASSSSAKWLESLLRISPTGTSRRRIDRSAELLSASDREGLYDLFVSHWSEPQQVIRNSQSPRRIGAWAPQRAKELGDLSWMMLVDGASYLPDDILVKVDRATMSVGLEARAPLLDYRVAEFAATLPESFKFDGHSGKRILRDLLYDFVPRELVDRPKQGFGVPLAQWLRGPLRDWAEDLLSVPSLRDSGVLMADPIRVRWEAHVAEQADWSVPLWDILMFQSWRRGLAGDLASPNRVEDAAALFTVPLS